MKRKVICIKCRGTFEMKLESVLVLVADITCPECKEGFKTSE